MLLRFSGAFGANGSVFLLARFFVCGDVGEGDAREACALCHWGFVGGWLLGCRDSAKSVFQKAELAPCVAQTAAF